MGNSSITQTSTSSNVSSVTMQYREADGMVSRYCATDECDLCTNSQCLHECHRRGGVREPRRSPTSPLIGAAEVELVEEGAR